MMLIPWQPKLCVRQILRWSCSEYSSSSSFSHWRHAIILWLFKLWTMAHLWIIHDDLPVKNGDFPWLRLITRGYLQYSHYYPIIIPILFHMVHNPMIVPLFSRYLPWFSKLAKTATYVFQLLDTEKIQQTPSIFIRPTAIGQIHHV